MNNDLRPDELQLWRQAYRQARADAPTDRPDDEALAAMVTGETQGEARAALADRIVADPRASDDYRTLQALHRAAGQAPAARRPSLRRYVALAAVLALAVLGGLWLWQLERQGTPVRTDVMRGSQESAALISPAPDTTLVAPPQRLSWTPQPGAQGYRVQLFDAGATLLWRSEEVSEPTLDLTTEALASLSTDGAYFWTVEAEGGSRSRLGPYHFHLARADAP